MQQHQPTIKISKTTILVAAIQKATTDAISEFMLHQGNILTEREITELADLKTREYQSLLARIPKPLSSEEESFILEKFNVQWDDTYNFVQQCILEIR